MKVVKLQNQKSVEVDLTKASVTAGDYKLSGLWDWSAFTVSGVIHVRPLEDFGSSRLEASSQDRWLGKADKTLVTV